jgi:GntR family transcriptional regulator
MEGAGLLPEMAGLDEGTPLFIQVAERLAEEIADGSLAEGERVPSTNELAAFYRINPATAAKGISMLADDGLVEKHRGIGMFVAAGARERLLAERRKRFAERYVEPLVTEAGRLGIDADELVALIRESGYVQRGTGYDASDLGGRPDPPLPRPSGP